MSLKKPGEEEDGADEDSVQTLEMKPGERACVTVCCQARRGFTLTHYTVCSERSVRCLKHIKPLITPRKITVLASTPRYRRFILSARAPVALNSPAQYSRLDSDWLSMFVSFISWKNDSNNIASLCFYRYSYGVDYSIILRMIFRTISL